MAAAFFGLNFAINNGCHTVFINSTVFMVDFSGLIRFLHGLSLWKFAGFTHAALNVQRSAFQLLRDRECAPVLYVKERGHKEEGKNGKDLNLLQTTDINKDG